MQPGDAMLGEAFAPQRYGRAADPVAPRHRAVGITVRQPQDHLRTTRQRDRKALRSSDRLKLVRSCVDTINSIAGLPIYASRAEEAG